jgi:predicted DNA-binding transcriptional regulator AlpA
MKGTQPLRCKAEQGTCPTHICATWEGTGSVADASRALGFSWAKGYDLVRRGEFPRRVLRVGRSTRVVTASLLRVLESEEQECNGAPRRTLHPVAARCAQNPRWYSGGDSSSHGHPYNAGVRETGLTRLKTSRAAYRLRHRTPL